MSNPRKIQRLVGAIFLIAIGLLVIGPFILTSDDNRRVLVDEQQANNDLNEEPISVLSTLSDNMQRESESQSANADQNNAIHDRPYQPAGEIKESPVPEDLWSDIESGKMRNDEPTEQYNAQSPHNVANNDRNDQSTSFERSQQQTSTVKPEQKSPNNQAQRQSSALPDLDLASSSGSSNNRPTANASTNTNRPNTATGSTNNSAQYQWFVQVGVFQNSNNAQKQYQNFNAAGYPVYIEQEGNLNKVRLGPYKTRENATRVQNNLKEAGIPTSLVPPRS